MTEPAPQALPSRANGPDRPPSDRAERTRQRILEAAGRCFAATGYSKTTVEEIASQAGVSKGIVYHHFDDKERLLERVIEQLCADWIDVSGLPAWIERTETLEDALAGMLRGSLSYARTHPLVKGLFQLDPLVTRGLGSSDSLKQLLDTSRTHMVDALRGGVRRGEIRADLDPERLADVIRLVDMALIDHLLAPEWIDVSDDAFVETTIDVLFRGIGGAR